MRSIGNYLRNPLESIGIHGNALENKAIHWKIIEIIDIHGKLFETHWECHETKRNLYEQFIEIHWKSIGTPLKLYDLCFELNKIHWKRLEESIEAHWNFIEQMNIS